MQVRELVKLLEEQYEDSAEVYVKLPLYAPPLIVRVTSVEVIEDNAVGEYDPKLFIVARGVKE